MTQRIRADPSWLGPNRQSCIRSDYHSMIAHVSAVSLWHDLLVVRDYEGEDMCSFLMEFPRRNHRASLNGLANACRKDIGMSRALIDDWKSLEHRSKCERFPSEEPRYSQRCWLSVDRRPMTGVYRVFRFRSCRSRTIHRRLGFDKVRERE